MKFTTALAVVATVALMEVSSDNFLLTLFITAKERWSQKAFDLGLEKS
jgi:hypothetical protein